MALLKDRHDTVGTAKSTVEQSCLVHIDSICNH